MKTWDMFVSVAALVETLIQSNTCTDCILHGCHTSCTCTCNPVPVCISILSKQIYKHGQARTYMYVTIT